MIENVAEKWHPEITHHSRAPFMLVGTKTDLRFNEEMVEALAKKDKEPVTFAEGASLARLVVSFKPLI